MNPAMILIRPQMGENIGAAARVMANFGLTNLRLVAPRDGWPNPKAADMAARALSILDDAMVYATAAEAVADTQFVLATTARDRAVALPVFTPRTAMAEIQTRMAQGQRVGILFGPERTGLENEEIAVADGVLTIPVSEAYPSLNLAQAVAVVAYEWMQSVAGDAWGLGREDTPAPRAELLGMFGQLEGYLDAVNFWRVPEKKEIMWRNLRTSLMRAGFSSDEVRSWRGVFKALMERR
ncbi:MAG: RNA methyltransferase [Alphaproteobacteria bacterium]